MAQVDLYRYDEAWEKKAEAALPLFLDVKRSSQDGLLPDPKGSIAVKDGAIIIDLRQPADFDVFNIPGSVNLPFADPSKLSPFSDPAVLRALWIKLEDFFKTPSDYAHPLIQGKRILLLCYDGDSSRVATSVLRAKGYEADSLRGGFRALGELDIRQARGECIVSNSQGSKQGIAVTCEVQLVTPS